jgi:hypothetical protein
VKLYNFDLLAYPGVPKEAPRTPVPSNYFDPLKGAANYAEHLEEMAYCEELGFDGVVFNEHHYSAYGTMPSPNLIAAALSQKNQKDQDRCPRQHLTVAQSSRARRRRVRHD